MDLESNLTTLVQHKVGKVIERDLNDKVRDEDSHFDIESYTDQLFIRYFPDSEVENLKNEILVSEQEHFEKSFASDESNDSDKYSQESFEFDSHEIDNLSTEKIITNLQSSFLETRIRCLKEINIFAEDLINQSSWDVIKKILQNLLENEMDRDTQVLTMKIFQKFLFAASKQQMVTEAFICLAETVSVRLEIINLLRKEGYFEEIYDLKENRWLTSGSLRANLKNPSTDDSEVLIKSMFLLLRCQKQMPGKWTRFNCKRLREIVFAFIHLLSSTTNSEYEVLTGLELVSILNPSGNWCRHWCHTATGRNLLCSALKKYKTLFVHLVEIILVNVKSRKSNHLLPVINNLPVDEFPPINDSVKRLISVQDVREYPKDKENQFEDKNHSVRSAPTKSKIKAKTSKKSMLHFIENIPRRVANQAVFCHSFSVVVALIQFRSGRALFPIQTTATKRLLSVQDLVSSMTTFVQNFEKDNIPLKGTSVTTAYYQHMTEINKVLKEVQLAIYSSRNSATRLSHYSHR